MSDPSPPVGPPGSAVDADRGARPHLTWAVTIGAGVLGGILALDVTRWLVGRLQGLLIVLLVSVFLSFAMEPAVQWMARHDVRRGFATGLVFLALIVLAAGFIAAMAPLVIDQVERLIEQGPDLLRSLQARAQDLPGRLGEQVPQWLANLQQDLPSRVPGLIGGVAGNLVGFGTTVFGAILQALTVALVTFYLVADGPKVRRTLVSRMPPERQVEVLGWWELAVSKTGGYVYSRVLTAIVSAVFHIIAFTIIGLDYPLALGVWVGVVSSVLPVVGTYLAGALPLLIALAGDPIDALWVFTAIVVYQQIENYLVAPRITAHTMELHPAVAFLSVLAGGALLGAVGALLALPFAAIVTALASAAGERHDVVAHDLVRDVFRDDPHLTGELPASAER